MINRFQSQLTDLLLLPEIDFLSSAELESEIFETLDAPKLTKYVKPDIKAEFKTHFPDITLRIEVTSSVSVCSDPKDDFLLALAQDGQADYLITGDTDLLSIKVFGTTKIIKMSDFIVGIQG